MKKFLSLVLALIMTMSLVTISAGATEYRDLTDKDEIQYEEAVAVLNRIGVITGYEDGSFRPEGELTRGAAAKIIVSLLIGPEAASNLPNATAPYPDVPASHTFAGVISYCKTAGIISGYGDGTFKPGNSLTGFAFAKMLLGALGYKSEIEGFVDTGWTMNVARVGNVTGLFDRLDFDGAGAVNRETACQLALNTLKATMVTYGGTTLVTGAQALAVQGTQAMYVTSNNREINANINRRVISATNNEMTLEFGEEHFKDLRLEHDKYDPAYDDFGRPSDQWSWKKVTIGTFPLPADFTYTTQISYREDSVATKEKALGLRGYDTYSRDHRGSSYNWSSPLGGGQYTNVSSPFDDATQITINGYDARANATTGVLYDYDAGTVRSKEGAPTLAEIADLTDNGVTVEVYVCPVDADFITNVVVVRTQMMKVKRIGSDYVTLDRIDPDSRDPRKAADLPAITGYNAFAIDVDTIDVKDNNFDAYNTLKDLKAGDKVAVIPYTPDQNKTWEVSEAYVPETASGRLTDVGLYMNTSKTDGNATSITIGGTKYVINEWNKDMIDVKKAQINATRKDVTAYLAKDGTVLWADEIGNSDAWMIVGDYYQAANASGKVVWFAHGWTIGGEEVDVDLGTIRGEAEKYAPGELVRYVLAEAGTGEYKLTKPNANGKSKLYGSGNDSSWDEPVLRDKNNNITGEGIYNVAQFVLNKSASRANSIHPANSLIALERYWNYETGNTFGNRAFGGDIFGDEVISRTPLTYDNGGTPATAVAGAAYDTSVTPAVKNETGHIWDYRSTTYKNDGVKFIYVNFDSTTGNVDYVSVRKDAQTVENEELTRQNTRWVNVGTNVKQNWVVSPAEAYVNEDGHVEAVVIKTEPAAADLSNVVIVGEYVGTETGKNLGAENASAIANSHTRWYYQGPNFDERKEGVFKNQHDVGDIVVIRSTDSNGVMDCKAFNGNVFENRNPDVIRAKGIAPLKNDLGSKSKIAFYVGTKDGYTVTNQTGSTAITGDIMTDLKTEADNLEDLNEIDNVYTGLIKVAGAKWIDLRANRGSREVESLSDLLDLVNESVDIKILVNAKSTTDGFRRAYAIVVMAGVLDDEVVESGPSVTIPVRPLARVNDILLENEGSNVTIDDEWAPGTADLGEELYLPPNTTLTIDGDLDLSNVDVVTFCKGSKLVVNGDLTGAGTKLNGKNANVKAEKISDVTSTSTSHFQGTMTVTDKLSVDAALTIAKGAAVTVTKEVEVDSSATLTVAGTLRINGTSKDGATLRVTSGTVNVTGTVYVGSSSYAGTVLGAGTINVRSTSSLHVYGRASTVAGVTIVAGNNDKEQNGLVEIQGTLKSTATFEDKNVLPDTGVVPTQKIAEVEGTIKMIATSKLSTEKFAPTQMDLAKNATIILEKGTNNSDVKFTDASSKVLATGNNAATVVVGVATTGTVSGSTDVKAEVTDNSTGTAPAGKEDYTVTFSALPAENAVIKVKDSAGKYTVTIDATGEAKTVRGDESLTFTVTPAEGKKVTAVKVGETVLTKNAAGEYTVSATGTVTVTVEAASEPTPSKIEITAVTAGLKTGGKITADGLTYDTLPKKAAFEIKSATAASGPADAAKAAVALGEVTKWEYQAKGDSTWTAIADQAAFTSTVTNGQAGDKWRATLGISIASASNDSYQLKSSLNGVVTVEITAEAASEPTPSKIEITAVTAGLKTGEKITATGLTYDTLPKKAAFEIKSATAASGTADAAKAAVELGEITKWEYQAKGGSTWTAVADQAAFTSTVTNSQATDKWRATLGISIASASNDSYQLKSSLNGVVTVEIDAE